MTWFALSIRTRIILGFSLMAASFVVVAALAAYNSLRASEADARSQQVHRVINASDEMMLGLANMQSGVRGYLLTGSVAELDAYRLGAITFEQAWAYARDLTEGDAPQQGRLERIRAEGQRLVAELEHLRRLREKGARLPEVADAFVKGPQDDILSGIRSLHNELKDAQHRQLAERTNASMSLRVMGHTALIGGSVLALLAGLGLAGLLARSITRPVEETWADAKQTAGFKSGAARTQFRGDSFMASLTGIRHLQRQLSTSMEELRHARDEAQKASEAKSRFVANISHELRSPLNGILGVLQLLNRSSLTQFQRNSVNRAEMAARALLGVINDVLDFSKVEAGMMRLDPSPFEFDALLRDTSIVFAGALAGKPVDFWFDLDEQLREPVVGDDLRLRQVLINLGTNAIKFTESGEVIVRVRQLARTGRDVHVEIAVEDTGIGIAPEHRDRLFKEFGQADASTTRRYGGTGLGLVLCHKLVAMMGGELKVDSQPGRGSRFSFQLSLPLAADLPAGAASAPAPSPTLSPAGQPLRVLLAASCPRAREVYGQFARQLGWTLTEAQDAREALGWCERHGERFDVACFDWRLGANGRAPALAGDDAADGEPPLEVASRAAALLVPAGCAVVVIGPVEGLEHFGRLDEARGRLIGAYLTVPATASMLAAAAAEARGAMVQRADDAESPASSARPLDGMRLLLAEDNEINQFVARELLEAAGATIEIAVDGLDAIEKLARERFDAILMDVQMPRMDGLQATRHIRSLPGRRSDIPIIAMTANASDADRQDCLSAGMVDHVAKPFVIHELIQVLKRHAGDGQPWPH